MVEMLFVKRARALSPAWATRKRAAIVAHSAGGSDFGIADALRAVGYGVDSLLFGEDCGLCADPSRAGAIRDAVRETVRKRRRLDAVVYVSSGRIGRSLEAMPEEAIMKGCTEDGAALMCLAKHSLWFLRDFSGRFVSVGGGEPFVSGVHDCLRRDFKGSKAREKRIENAGAHTAAKVASALRRP